MIKKTLYFGNPTYLSTSKEQLVIELPEVTQANMHPSLQQKGVITRPIEDIGLILLDHPRITITQRTLHKLLENSCAIISCDPNHMPFGLCLPIYGNTLQSERFRHQLESSEPLRKFLWQQTIQYKISNQAYVLHTCTKTNVTDMYKWAWDVKSGDSTNMEARAAAFYWKNIFPEYPGFVREREGEMPNNLLNYGYAILRAIIARAIVMTGLIPTLGINHHNKYNPYCLADDLMEPYRPYVDLYVTDLIKKHRQQEQLTKDIKADLLLIPTLDVVVNKKTKPLMLAAKQTAATLYHCFIGKARKIAYPLMPSYAPPKRI